jgi:hypothetical protein
VLGNFWKVEGWHRAAGAPVHDTHRLPQRDLRRVNSLSATDAAAEANHLGHAGPSAHRLVVRRNIDYIVGPWIGSGAAVATLGAHSCRVGVGVGATLVYRTEHGARKKLNNLKVGPFEACSMTRFATKYSAVLAIVLALASRAIAQLETRDSFATATTPLAVVVGDFNHDGIMDIATASVTQGPEVQVFLGIGNGTFHTPTAYDVGSGSGPIVVADVNGDGNLDLIVVNGACPNFVCDDSVSVLLGNGDGTFQAPMNFSTPPGPVGLVLGDFNGDGLLDIATINQADYTTQCDCIEVLLGNGDGTFQEPPIVTYPPPSLPEALAVGHFDENGNLDLAVTEGYESSGKVQIMLGNSDGTFSTGKAYTLTPDLFSIAAADLRNNHRTDLVVGEFEGTGIAVLLGNGDGTFRQPVVYKTETPVGVAVADMNGDGIPDVVAATVVGAGPGLVEVLIGMGDGTFKSAVSYPAGEFPSAVAVADFNGDHLPDVTVSNQGGDAEIVLLNTGAVAFSPTTPLVFEKQAAGTTSPPQTVALTNTGKGDLKIPSMKTTGQFGVTSTCGTSVAAGAKCTITVTFSPKSQGPKWGTVTINDSASSKPQVIELSGNGT